MKKYLTTAFAAALLNCVGLVQAQDQQTEATITRVTGTATFSVGGGAAQPLAVGARLPQGAEITTADLSDVMIQAHDGIVAIAGSNTTVTIDQLSVSANGVRNAAIGLKSGNLASSLDPARKNLNNYSVRTPKGVAAARGTTYSVSYNGRTYSLVVAAGRVESIGVTGSQGFMIEGGNFSYTRENGEQIEAPLSLANAVGAFDGTWGDDPVALTEVMGLLGSAVAATATNVADVNAVVTMLANSNLARIGGSTERADRMASMIAATAATAATNPNLTSTTGGATGVVSAIVSNALDSSSMRNSRIAGKIVTTTTAVVASITGESVETVASALVATANSKGVGITETNVIAAANAANAEGGGWKSVAASVTVQGQGGTTTSTETLVTPPMSINPDISASPAGS